MLMAFYIIGQAAGNRGQLAVYRPSVTSEGIACEHYNQVGVNPDTVLCRFTLRVVSSSVIANQGVGFPR